MRGKRSKRADPKKRKPAVAATGQRTPLARFANAAGQKAKQRTINEELETSKEARDFSEAIVDTVRESMVVLDSAMRVLKANRSFYRMFKVRPADIEGKSIYEVNDGQWNIPSLRRFLDEILPRNAFFNDLEIDRFFDPIGQRCLLLNGRRVFQEGGGEPLILLAIEDVTDRRRGEEALRFSERRYRRLFESTKDGVLIVNQETCKIIDANPFMTQLLGYSREEFIDKTLWSLGLFGDERASRAPLEQLQEKGHLRLDDLVLSTKTGERRVVELVANLCPEDGHSVIQCNIRDTTRRNEAEVALGQSEERFRQLADAIPQLVWTALPTGETDYLNKRWFEYTGVTDEAQLKAGWLYATHADDRGKTLTYWQQALDNEADFGVEHRIFTRTGYRWFKTRAAPIRNAQGEIVRWFGTSTDIDDVVKARETLAHHQVELEDLVLQRTSELQNSNKQLEAFVYTIAHDLRAPLRSMEGFSTMLLEQAGEALNERCRDYALRIRHSAQHMDALLMDLLGFSRASQQRIELSPVPLESAMQIALSNLEQEIQTTQARVEATGPWPSVQAHEPTLVQVLVNLVSNALKFVRAGVPSLVRVHAEPQGEFVRVFVEDNGIGIKPEHHEQIFRLFTRLEGGRYPGTGIGLAIVQKGVERMGGRVGLESTPGQGSRFWFDLRAV
jgi:PAS domain S-box-containing protein